MKVDVMEADECHVSMISGGKEPESSKLPQYLVTLAATLIALSAGSCVGWSSPALAEMRLPNSTMHLTPEESSWVGSLLAIGAFVGAIPAGTMVDLIGRKWTLMSLSLPITVSWIMIHFAKTVNALYIARLLSGVGVGAVCATVPVYIVEIAESSIRGILGTGLHLMLVNGVLYSFVVGAIFPYTKLPLFCGAINIVFVILFSKAPESPVYLMKKGRKKEAEEALLCIRGQKYNVQRELQMMEKEISGQNAEKVPFLQEITKKSCLICLAICLALMTFQQLSGINVVIFYAESIFHDAGSSLDPAASSILVALAQPTSTLGMAALIDRCGRKILLQVSSLLMSLCLAALGYYIHLKKDHDVTEFGYVPVVAVIAFIVMYSFSFGPIAWLMSGEILPPEIKGTGLSIASSYKWILAFAVTRSFHPLSHAVGPAVTYWIFASICIVAFFFSTFVIIETKGKSLSEVQNELLGKNKSKKGKTNVVV